MSTERSDKVYQSFLEASQKFDYFVVSVAFALVGYLGAQYRPAPLGLNPASIEFAAVASLLFSGTAGLKRIEVNVIFLAIMHKRLYHEEVAGELTSAAMSRGPAVITQTGEVLSPTEMIARAQHHKTGAKTIGTKLEDLAESSGRWFRARNRSLILGLSLLILAKLTTAYM